MKKKVFRERNRVIEVNNSVEAVQAIIDNIIKETNKIIEESKPKKRGRKKSVKSDK